MLTKDVEDLISDLSKGNIFLPLGDFVEVMSYGRGPNYSIKFSGPCNNTVERSENCPVVHARDFGRLALFFMTVAKQQGVLGDTEIAIREILLNSAVESNRKSQEKSQEKPQLKKEIEVNI